MYGTVILGYNTIEEREVNIINYFQCTLKDDCKITIVETSESSFALTVTNTESSGKSPIQQMLLTKETFVSIFSTLALYFNSRNENVETLVTDIMGGDEIEYNFSPNLNPAK